MEQYTSPDACIRKEELYNAEMLDFLLRNPHIDKDVKDKLLKYKKQSKDNCAIILYSLGKKTRNEYIGRLTPQNAVGLTSMPRDIRNALARNHYHDLDIVNSHPSILENICKKHNIPCNNLSNYNCNREQILNSISNDRDIAKKEIMKCLFGTPTQITALPELHTEITNIVYRLLSDEIIPDKIQKLAKKNNESNWKGSALSLFLCEEEKKCLFALEKSLALQGMRLDTFIHDGGLVRKDTPSHILANATIQQCEQDILISTGYKLSLKEKEMHTTYEIVKEQDEYLNTKTEFEKSHFKLMEPLLYVRITDKGSQYLSKTELCDMYLNKYINTNEPFIKRWIQDAEIRTYNRLGFYPNEAMCPQNEYNLYEPISVSGNASRGDITLILDLMRSLVDYDDASFQYLLKYVADIFQNPERKAGVCIIFNGGQGTGKDTFWDFIGSLLAPYYYTTGRAEDNLYGRFNKISSCRLLIKLEEHPYDKKYIDLLKNIITAEELSYQEKQEKCITLKDHARYVITTNHDIPVCIEETDRRFVIFTPSSKNVGVRDYFKNVISAIENPDNRALFYEYMLSVSLEDFDIRERPTTKVYTEVKQTFRPYHAGFFEGYILDNNIIETKCWKAKDLYDEMNRSVKYPITMTRFGRDMNEVYVKEEIVRKTRKQDAFYYTIDISRMEEFLRKQGWWIEL